MGAGSCYLLSPGELMGVVGGGGGENLPFPRTFCRCKIKKNVCQKFLVTFMVENKEDVSKKLYSSFMLVVTLFV